MDVLQSSHAQFAFKPCHSTSMCTYVVKEVVQHYTCNNSEVYCCLLDASKAFDRIRVDKLFQLLLERQLSPLSMRVLLDLYTRQQLRSSYQQVTSDYFKTCNGIRQGAVSSPVLFNVYIDVLLQRLTDSGYGCHIGQQYVGTLGYADDVILLSPTPFALRNMLRVCEEFGEEYCITFNAKKSECILFGDRSTSDPPDMFLGGNKLRWESHVTHLGHVLKYDLSEIDDINSKRGDMFGRTNLLSVNFSASTSEVINNIFNTQCAHMYGVSAWNLRDRSIPLYSTAWNRCVRRIHGLPNTTHRRLLPHIVGRPAVVDQVNLRVCKMYETIAKSNNTLAITVLQIALSDPRSIAGGNKDIINATYDVDELSHSSISSSIDNTLIRDFQSKCYANCIVDCQNTLKGYYNVDLMDVDIATKILNLCTL